MAIRVFVLCVAIGLAQAQDLFLPVQENLKAQDLLLAVKENLTAAVRGKDCVPDYQCTGGHASFCCSGKKYFTAEALSCEVKGAPCKICQEVMGKVLSKLAAKVGCAEIDLTSAAMCAAVNIEDGDLLFPFCEMAVGIGCSYATGKLATMSTAAIVTGVCESTLGVCPGGKGSAHWCGCLEKDECVDPLTASSDCCSGHWHFNTPFEHCNKDHHNIPGPARCA